jgi:hypothetical protein
MCMCVWTGGSARGGVEFGMEFMPGSAGVGAGKLQDSFRLRGPDRGVRKCKILLRNLS